MRPGSAARRGSRAGSGRSLAATLGMLLAMAAPARAVAPTPGLPLLLYGDESVAATGGARGGLFNPAAVGLRYHSELVYSRALERPSGEVDHALLSIGGLGLRGTRIKDLLQAYGVSLAGGDSERLRTGFAATWLVSGLQHEVKTDYRFGTLSRPAPWLSLGGTVDHVFEPDFQAHRLNREYTLGLGLRPLALSRPSAYTLGPRLTLSGDLLLPEDGEWGQARVRIGAELEPVLGVLLRGSVEDHGGFHVGIGILGPRAGLHAGSRYQNGDHRVDTYNLSIHDSEDLTALVPRRQRRVAELRLGGTLGDDRLGGASLFGSGSTTPVGPIHGQLERALDDPLTRGVLLDLGGISNLAQVEELRPRVARLRDAGKPVVAYLEEGATRGDLYLAAACDRIVTTREADFSALGLRVERRYYRRLLADWGVRIDRSSVGRYKSAFRNFSVDSTPAPDREVIERVLDQQQELFVSAVAADRHMDRERLLTLLDGRAWPAREVQRAGLVDSIGYREDALRTLGALCGLGDRPRAVSLNRVHQASRAWAVPERVAVVYASGALDSGPSGNDLLLGPTLGVQTVTRQIESAFKRPGVRAVVLRVESPGGTSIASDLIDHALVRMKRETKKPLVVSMGSLAASGGYQISAHGDRLFADRFTRTGSIGVVFVKPSIEGWDRKHEVREDDFDRGRYMRGWSLHQDWDRALQASADSSVQESYRGFVARVAEGRRLPVDEVDAVAQGRVWLGEDAKARKLVDEIGGLAQAIAEARRRGGIPAGEKIRIAEYRRPLPGFLQRLVGQAVSEAWERSMRLPEPGELLHWADDDFGP